MNTQRIKFDPARIADLELLVEVGDVLSEEGLTRVKLQGIGKAVIERQRGKEVDQRLYSDIDRDRTETVFRHATQFDWDIRFPSRPGLPDEAIIHWILSQIGGPTVEIKTWLRDAEKQPAMAPVLTLLRDIAQETSHGELYL